MSRLCLGAISAQSRRNLGAILAKATLVHAPRPGNTAVRAPGVIASVPCHESILEAVADATGIDADTLRETNLYANGDVTPTVCGGMTLGNQHTQMPFDDEPCRCVGPVGSW